MSDISISCPRCGASRLVKREWAGKSAKCACGAAIVIPTVFESPSRHSDEDSQLRVLRHILTAMESCATKLAQIEDGLTRSIDEIVAGSSGGATPTAGKQYKVLTQKDKWFTGKFDPELLERAMNAYAEQGWSVLAVTTASIPGFGGNREELIVVLER